MLSKQKGVSYIGIFLAIVLAAFAMKLAVAIWPSYWDDRLVDKLIVDTLAKAPKGSTPSTFKNDLRKSLEMNRLDDLKVDDIVKVTNTAGLAVQKHYEVRKPFMSNIELLMTFKKDFDQRSIATK